MDKATGRIESMPLEIGNGETGRVTLGKSLELTAISTIASKILEWQTKAIFGAIVDRKSSSFLQKLGRGG